MNKVDEPDEMRPEYDFTGGIRGKHYRRYRQGHTVTVRHSDGATSTREFPPEETVIHLAPDVLEYFPNDEAVNQALRCLIPLLQAERQEKIGV